MVDLFFIFIEYHPGVIRTPTSRDKRIKEDRIKSPVFSWYAVILIVDIRVDVIMAQFRENRAIVDSVRLCSTQGHLAS